MALRSMRGRLMSYTKGMMGGARLRERIAQVGSLAGIEDIAAFHIATVAAGHDLPCSERAAMAAETALT